MNQVAEKIANVAKPRGGAQPGQRRGGRQKGTPNKRTVATIKAVQEGISPLEYMLKVMRNPKADKERRDDMARAAAPYIHAKISTPSNLANLSVGVAVTETVEGADQVKVARQIAFALRLGIEAESG